MILLGSLSASYSSFRDTILYNRETLTVENVYDALFSKEKIKHLVGATSRDEKILVFHGDDGRADRKSTSAICIASTAERK